MRWRCAAGPRQLLVSTIEHASITIHMAGLAAAIPVDRDGMFVSMRWTPCWQPRASRRWSR
ncbi:MAG: hypothetical protein U1E43_01905 [Rhodospirillales bacterium]